MTSEYNIPLHRPGLAYYAYTVGHRGSGLNEKIAQQLTSF